MISKNNLSIDELEDITGGANNTPFDPEKYQKLVNYIKNNHKVSGVEELRAICSIYYEASYVGKYFDRAYKEATGVDASSMQ